MKHLILYSLLILFSQCGGTEPETSEDLTKADFNFGASEAVVGQNVAFTNTTSNSESVVSWNWDFMDGTENEVSKDCSHSFLKAGSYLVTLTANLKTGKKTAVSKRFFVKNLSQPDFGQSGTGINAKLVQLGSSILVCAHRTLHDQSPENSVQGIEAAALEKINMVEIDARMTLDGALVLMHDASTMRTTNGNLTISQSIASDLKKLRLLYNGVATDYSIPTLQEALLAAKGKVYVDIDLSWDNALNYYNKIYNEVAACNMVNMVVFYTESPEVAKGLISFDNEVVVLLGAGDDASWKVANNMNPKAKIWHLSSTTLHDNYTSGPGSEGIRFFANAYVNSSAVPTFAVADDVVDNLLKNHISIIQTDYPVKLKDYLKKKSLWMP